MGNFGPGFDVTSLALAWGGDTVKATRLESGEGDEVVVMGVGARGIPTSWVDNAAAVSFDAVRERLGESGPVRLEVDKGVPPGSGLGSSASSAAGGVLAALALYGPEELWTPAMMLEAALVAEQQVAGKHGDDVAAALLGGLAMVRGGECRRWDPPEGLAVAIVRPEFSLPTRGMRGVLPKEVPLGEAVENLASLAFLLSAWQGGDATGVAACLGDRLAMPYRRVKIPFFDAAQEAAVGEGAGPVAISGSGPSLFTVTQDLQHARAVSRAMAEAVRASGVEAEAVACHPEGRHVFKEALGWS